MTSLSSELPSPLGGPAGSGAPVVGFRAGWALEFRMDNGKGFPAEDVDPVRVSAADCDAELMVEADDQLRAATFDITLDGLIDKVYRAIATDSHVHVLIKLGWQDLGTGFVAALKSAVAPFGLGGPGQNQGLYDVLAGRLTSVERSHGEFRYRTRLRGIDAAFHRMQRQAPRPGPVTPGDTDVQYAAYYCANSLIDVAVLAEGDPTPIDGRMDTKVSATVVEALQTVARLAHGGDRRFVVPMFLRGGGTEARKERKLHVGRWKPPSADGNTWELTPQTGLVDCRPVADARPGGALPEQPFAAPMNRRFDLTLLGRPDIDVGDKVRAHLPDPAPSTLTGTVSPTRFGPERDVIAGIAAALGPAGTPSLDDYAVVGVRHHLGPADGFVTRLTVAVPPADTAPAAAPEPGSTDQATLLAASLAEQRRRDMLQRRTHEVGLVRRQDTAPAHEAGHETPAQTLRVDEGLADAPSPNVPSTANPAPTPTQLVDKPYLTPFAFGAAGLVVPHYPGTRVVSLHYREEAQNAVVAGCLWENGRAPRSHPGDWWLCLPTNLAGPGTGTPSAGDPATAVRPAGPASHDLTSGGGGRVIQARGLRISVGAALMNEVGDRPQDAADDKVLIEHAAAGARIGIDSSGTIEIATGPEPPDNAARITIGAGGDIEISTPGNLTLKGSKITLNAQTVEVP